MADIDEFGDGDEFDMMEEFGDDDEFDMMEESGDEDELAFDETDSLADAAMDDPDAEDEFLGMLGGLAASLLPKLAKTVVPAVLKLGRGLIRGGARRAVRGLPKIIRTASRIIAKNPRAVRRNPARARAILHRCARVYVRRGRGRMRRVA